MDKSIPLIFNNESEPGSMQYIPFNRTYEAMKAAELIAQPYNVGDAYTTQFVK